MTEKPSRQGSFADLISTLEQLDDYQKTHALEHYKPYAKQIDFHDLGVSKRERMFMAGNQLGKTFSGAAECAMHLTGQYPDWWLGRRFGFPTMAIVGSKTAELTRDGAQRLLVGQPASEELWGRGSIPKDCLLSRTRRQGIANALDSVSVKHVSGGVSTLLFKSYDQGREKWQANTAHVVWFDEEPPYDVYSEGLTRTTATKGIVFVTFTPLMGRSDVVNRYLDEENKDRAYVQMTIEEAEHISDEDRQSEIDKYPPHEREARAFGIPIFGDGRIFPYAEEILKEPYIPERIRHWYYLWSIDFGGAAHPFAAVLNAYDKDADCVHVVAAVRLKGRPIDHVAAMKPLAPNVPVAWPQDGTARESDGATLADKYKQHGLKMLDFHATWPDGGLSTNAGIIDMQERMTTGRYKICESLHDWWDEFRQYHTKDQKIVKVRDDLMSASRVGVMMLRYAKPWAMIDIHAGNRPQAKVCEGIDFNVLS